jgi:integrase
MTPFKRWKRPKGPYYLWVTLPGRGRVGPWSTGTRNKALAKSMETYLRETALQDPELIRGLIEHKYNFRELWVARQEGRTEQLKQRAKDPLLRDVVERFRGLVRDIRIEQGLDQLLALSPEGARLSFLTGLRETSEGAKNVSDLCALAVRAGRKPNSVRRSLYRAISDLLTYEVGKVRRSMILTDVVKPGERDERDVTLTPEQITRLLEHADIEMRDLIEAALLTGVDRGPLLRLRASDFHAARETLRVPDTKTEARPRTLELSGAAAALLRRLTAGRGGDDRVFPLTHHQVEHRFRAIRAEAGLEHVRFKDLRGVFATYWEGSLRDLQQAMGHANARTTMRYIKGQAVRRRAQMDEVAERMGLARHLRLEKGGTGS